MPIDASKLLAFRIPEGRQSFTPEDAAFYALSIGMAHDPLDRRQLDFVLPDAPSFRVLPSFALVLAHPGFWLSHPDSGVEPGSVLHARQALRLLAPLPTAGTVVSKSRITGLLDKGPGEAALLQTETTIEREDGTLLAALARTTFVRDGGGFGGGDSKATPPNIAIPDRRPDYVVELTTRLEQALVYRLNGDFNPLHSDPAIAKAAGFSRPLLHGLCTAGIVCHAVIKALSDYDPTRLASLEMRFAGHVLPGETIRTELWTNGSFRASVIERDRLVIDDGAAVLTPALAVTDFSGADR